MPTLDGALATYYAYKIGILLSKKFTDWDMYKLKLIDEKGNIIKDPKTQEEKVALNPVYNFARKLKWLIVKYLGDRPTINTLIAYLLIKSESELNEEEKIFVDELNSFLKEENYFTYNEFINILNKIKNGGVDYAK